MNTPIVKFFTGRSELFVRDGRKWHRLTAEDEARGFTGICRETHEANVGVYVTKRPNGLMRVGFDLWKLGANLRASVIERIANRWQQREAVNLSKSMLRSVDRRVHISKSFARFEISLHRLEEWQAELSAVLSNPESYQSL